MSVGARKRVKWKGVELGDYAFVTFSYQGNNEVRVIPEAKGVKIRGTNELGGGVLRINVNALVAKDNRFELEDYFNDLDSNLSLTVKGDLTIEDENGGPLTLSDCYLDSFSQGGEDFRVTTFNMQFIKSL